MGAGRGHGKIVVGGCGAAKTTAAGGGRRRRCCSTTAHAERREWIGATTTTAAPAAAATTKTTGHSSIVVAFSFSSNFDNFSSGQLVRRQFVKRAGLLARAMPFLVVVVFFTHLTIGVGTFGHFGKSGFGGAKGSRGMVNQCFNSTTSVCNVAKSVVCLNGAPVGWEVVYDVVWSVSLEGVVALSGHQEEIRHSQRN